MPSPNSQTSPIALAVEAAVVVVVDATPGVPDLPAVATRADPGALTGSAECTGIAGTGSTTRLGVPAGTGDRDETEPPRREPDTAAGVDATLTEPGDPAFAARRAPERVDRGPALTPVADPETALAPDSAPEPVVSAHASHGIDAIAVPTPSATASAPTRPA